MYKYLVIIFVCLSLQVIGQTSEKYNSVYANFYRAEELFQKEQFGSARYEFRTFIDQFQQKNDALYQKSLYYEAICALELYQNDAVKLLTDFNTNYPESIYREGIYFKLGQYFYQQKKYKNALEWLNKLKPSDVEPDQVEEYYFKVGYSDFQESKFPEARNAFYEIKEGTSQYASPALYYFSHIAYQDKSYQIALEGFLKLQSVERFAKIAPYYIVQIYHSQGKYDEVTKFAPTIVDTTNLVNANDMNHLLGDAYYRLKKYDEAIPYLLQYNKKTQTLRSDDYQLGFSYYKAGMFNEAIKMFNNVVQIKDTIGQTAYYHIGESYLKLDKMSAARAAFEEASKIDMDPKIKEDALYNYAVLSYKLDVNPYDEAVEAMQFYLKHYPKSIRKDDIYQYLVTVYTTTNNYAKALQSLEKLPNKDTRLKAAYQIVAFNRGVELYQKVDYPSAISSFELVDRYPIDPVITGRAKYWASDAYFQQKKYDKAIQGYKTFLTLPATLAPELKSSAYYNIGYAYYANNDTLLGIEAFRTYTQQSNLTNKHKLADACMRAADGCYVTRQNETAIKYYSEALKLKSGYEDQALYYLAKAYGYSPNGTPKKIEHLQDLINNYKDSKYMLSAIEDLAITFKGIEEYDKAKSYFEQIISDYPSNVLVKAARVEIADIHYKKQEFQKCELAYKLILEEFGEDREMCEIGAKGLITLYNALKQPVKALEIGEKYPCAGMTKNQQEELFFAPAKEMYDDTLSPLSVTISKFEDYLTRYPEGIYAKDAKNHLADCYYRSNNMEQAITIYIKTLEDPTNGFTEIAAIRVSKYLFNNKKYEEAIPYYERLEKISNTPSVVYNSKLGLMRSYFLLEKWQNASVYAKSVLETGQLNTTIRLEAEYSNALSNYALKNYTDAKPSLEWLVKNTTTVTGAEAKFLLAEMCYDLKDLEKADVEIRGLLKMKPTYNYWVAKALILQARVLILKDDLFQTEETLQSVIENYPNKEDGIIAEANEVWEELMLLKNTDKEIAPKTTTEIEVNEESNDK